MIAAMRQCRGAEVSGPGRAAIRDVEVATVEACVEVAKSIDHGVDRTCIRRYRIYQHGAGGGGRVSPPVGGDAVDGTRSRCADRWRLEAVRHMLSGMFTQNEWTDFSVVVKSRRKPPNPWRWEIYRAGRSSAIAQSSKFFPTMAAANKAGKVALAELFKKLGIRTD